MLAERQATERKNIWRIALCRNATCADFQVLADQLAANAGA
jgi:hypothetical protein